MTATMLAPAARLLWRSARQAQIELGSRAVILDGVGTDTVRRLLGRAEATTAKATATATATATAKATVKATVTDTVTDTASTDAAVAVLQERLIAEGYLWPGPDSTAPQWFGSDARRSVAYPRLAGELTALSARAGERGAELLAARRRCTVVVQGTGRVGPQLVAVLAAAGVGRVHAVDLSPARLRHAVPGGLAPADEGMPFATAAALAAERQAPDAVCVPAPFGQPPDLVVLAVDEPIDDERRTALHARSTAHLVVRVVGGHGAVGPLVLPGLTSCLRCADLHRLDRDPAWDALAAQLSITNRDRGASEVALATTIGGIAAVQALDFLDGGRPAVVEGTLEMQLPDWRLRRRSWPIHPDCDCLPLPHPE